MSRFSIETLELRRLFSVVGGVDPSVLAEPPGDALLTVVNDAPGPISGTITRTFGNPDVGAVLHFDGSGVGGLIGTISLKGNLHLPGFVAEGHAQGNLILTFMDGSTQTLHVKGALEPGFGPVPTKLHFTVTAATGSESNAVGTTGVILLARSAGHHFTMTFR